MDLQKIDNIEVDDVAGDSPEESIPFEYSITSYGADFTVDNLVGLLQQEEIFIPHFQREIVWDQRKQSRFVESLLLGLPVPGIFLSREEDTKKLIVVDGQQRLESLRSFYEGKFALTGLTSRFQNQDYKSLQPEDRRDLDFSILHATIIRQDEPSDDNSSIYQVFERLNTGGMPLQPQEIRAAMYHGPFNDLLRNLNANSCWRELYGKEDGDSRMKDQELILRFLAMYFEKENYRSPLKTFLNKYMAGNRYLKRQSAKEIKRVFKNTIKTVYTHLGLRAFKPSDNRRFTAAVFDSVAVGVAYRLKRGDIQDSEDLKAAYDTLMKNNEYGNTTFGGTAHTNTVKRRLTLAIEAFSNVP